MTVLQAQPDAPVLAPVRGKDRIAASDVLRGYAILETFLINLPAMSGPLTALLADFRTLGWSLADQQVWLFLETFLEGTSAACSKCCSVPDR